MPPPVNPWKIPVPAEKKKLVPAAKVPEAVKTSGPAPAQVAAVAGSEPVVGSWPSIDSEEMKANAVGKKVRALHRGCRVGC